MENPLLIKGTTSKPSRTQTTPNVNIWTVRNTCGYGCWVFELEGDGQGLRCFYFYAQRHTHLHVLWVCKLWTSKKL